MLVAVSSHAPSPSSPPLISCCAASNCGSLILCKADRAQTGEVRWGRVCIRLTNQVALL